jgi:predicted Zn-dependent protease
VKKGIASLQLTTVDRLRQASEKLTAAQRISLDRIEAQALATQGQRDKALAAFAKLAAGQPADASVQEAYAELLASGNERTAWEQGLAQWRKVAAKSKPRTAGWYRAKYAIAELQIKLKDPAAAQLIRYLLETPPGVDAEWQGKFELLLRQAEKTRS